MATPFFNNKSLSKDHFFFIILSNLHVSDNMTTIEQGNPGHGNYHKLRPLIIIMHANLLKYTPDQNLSLDHGMYQFKGQVHFRVHNPAKQNKFVLKQYELSGSKLGICCGFRYLSIKVLLKGDKMIIFLMRPYEKSPKHLLDLITQNRTET